MDTQLVERIEGIESTLKATLDTMQDQKADKGFVDSSVTGASEKLKADLFGELDKVKAQLRELEEAKQLAGILGDTAHGDAAVDWNHDSRIYSRITGVNIAPGQLQKIVAGEAEYFRTGIFPSEVRADMETLTDSKGGYLVTPVMDRVIMKLFRDMSPVRQICNVVRLTTSNEWTKRVRTGVITSSWVDEREKAAAATTPSFSKVRIPVYRQESEPIISQDFLDDADINIDQFIAEEVAEEFAIEEGTAVVAGDGDGKPKGITVYTTAATADSSRAFGSLEHVATGVSADFAASNKFDIFMTMIGKLKAQLRAGSTWIMSRATLATVFNIKQDSKFLWSMNDVQGGPFTFRILGFPVLELEDMPAIGADTLSIGFGNFRRGYTIVDRMGTRILRDPYTGKPDVKFYHTRRVGGGVVDSEAIKLMKFGT